MWTGSKPFLSKRWCRIYYNHKENFHFLTLGKEKENTLDDSFLKFMRKNTAWHLILAAVSVQYEQKK